MEALITVRVPNIGVFARIPVTEVLVGPGDTVRVDTPLIVVASDKATMTISSTDAGVVSEVLVEVDGTVSKGDPILTLTPLDAAGAPGPTAAPGEGDVAWQR